MELNRNKLNEILNSKYDGNYSKFAKDLDLDMGHFYKFLKTGTGGGRKIISAVHRFCIENGLSFDDFIVV